MKPQYEHVKIDDCPRDRYNPGATFTMAEIIDMAYHGILPSGTYFSWCRVHYLFYDGVRYELTDDDDVDESSAAIVVKTKATGKRPKWVACKGG